MSSVHSLSTILQILKKNTLKNYEFVTSPFRTQFRERELDTITPDEILPFLIDFTKGAKQSTKKLRYANLKAFFNFIRNTFEPTLENPCETPMLKKIFKAPKKVPWAMLEKDIVDEIIFRMKNPRNRIILELMARGGMRVGEVLKLRAMDIHDRKLVLQEPKSGKEAEVVFVPRKVSERLKNYVRDNGIEPEKRIFPLSYSAARVIVGKAGRMVNIHLTPHDLRRHAATYASRNGTPLEVISKVICRHAHLATTEFYLGKVSDIEAIRWIENLYA